MYKTLTSQGRAEVDMEGLAKKEAQEQEEQKQEKKEVQPVPEKQKVKRLEKQHLIRLKPIFHSCLKHLNLKYHHK